MYWKNYTLPQLKQAVATHTHEVLTLLKQHQVDIKWVQIGNETADGMLLPLGKIDYSNQHFASLINAGHDAVKQVYPQAQVIVHVDQGNRKERQAYVFDYLEQEQARFDMMGVSFYPKVENWPKLAEQVITNIRELGAKYHKPNMICEVGMHWQSPQATYELLSYLMKQGEHQTDGYYRGIFYWEPQAPLGYNGGYDKGAFYQGRPTHALDAFRP